MSSCGPHTFTIDTDLVEVTSLCRPDVGHSMTDPSGHTHRWCTPDGTPASSYTPSVTYTMPSLVWVKDGEAWYEDEDESHDVGHHECGICGAHVEPKYVADTDSQYVSGISHYRIDGMEVTLEEYTCRYAQAFQKGTPT